MYVWMYDLPCKEVKMETNLFVQLIERVWIQTEIIVTFLSILSQVLHEVVVLSILLPPSVDVVHPLSSVHAPIIQHNEFSHTLVFYSVHDDG